MTSLAVLVLGGEEGGIGSFARAEVDALHPLLAYDLPQEILDHPPVGERKPVTEVVLSHAGVFAGLLRHRLDARDPEAAPLPPVPQPQGPRAQGAVRGFGTVPGCACASAAEVTRSAR